MVETIEKQERAMLVALDTGEYEVEASLLELEELCETAGAKPMRTVVQKRDAPKAATCIGSGMTEQVAEICRQEEIDLLVFDRELSPTQIRNLEKLCGVRVVDRTMLILDIFAQRAQSSEGKLQVELAQLRYVLPRLGGQGTGLSRLGGGIGTRGPGETKLETDRRHIRRRIDSLNRQLKKVESARAEILKRRKKEHVVTVALVGYTNVGKSTLMNHLTQAGVLAEDKLFATLDVTARGLTLPQGKTVMLIDTVGLIRRLPHHLVEAFKSTLEQAATADVILNICDASSEEAAVHLSVAAELLQEMGSEGRPVIPVMNKMDKAVSEISYPRDAVCISAKTGEGVDRLLAVIEENLPEQTVPMNLLLPFSMSGVAAKLREEGMVREEAYVPEGLQLRAEVGERFVHLVADYQIPEETATAGAE